LVDLDLLFNQNSV